MDNTIEIPKVTSCRPEEIRLWADEVLEETIFSLSLLEEESDKRKSKIYWVATITLLKTVGSVLIHQSKEEGWYKSVVQPFYKKMKTEENLPENKIYYKFIKPLRNSMVHDYETKCFDGSIPIYWISSQKNKEILNSFQLEDLYIPLDSFDFEGMDVRDLVQEGIDFWKIKISEIKKTYMETKEKGYSCT